MHLLIIALLAAPPSPVEKGQARLPLKSMVLYENGVGYFERRGAVPNGQVAEIPLEPGQLDDALKSLVVMSAQGVASVEFAPPLSAEAARAMAGMPERDQQASLPNLCRSLTGVEVEVKREGGAAVKGRVIEVAEEAVDLLNKEGQPQPEPTLLVFGEGGLARVPLRRIDAIRPLGSQVSLAWSRAVGARALQPERERLVVRGASGGGPVAVGYTTEAPVWRTTYRLVMGKKSQRLQGFALVHNDSDETWDGVKVTLASGHPTSFLFPLAGPRYGRREMLAPQDGLDTAPQLATREAREHLRGEGEWVGVGMTGVGSGGGGYGMGTLGAGAVGTVGHGSGVGTMGVTSTILEDGPTPLEPAAVSEAGDLFLYSVKEPVVLGARKSALLPIVDGATKAERVTVLDGEGRVATGVRLENTTALTLEGGTLSVFTDGAYTGETQIDRVKPGEVRVLRHGEDLDLEVSRSTSREEGDPRKAKLTGNAGGRVLELTRVDRLVHRIDFTSRTDAPRVVLVELSEQKYRVVAGGTEDIRSPGQPRYGRISIAPRASETVDLMEEGAVIERIPADQLSSARLEALLARKAPEDVKALLVSLKGEIQKAEAARDRVALLDAKIRETEGDIARTRDNLAAVGKAQSGDAAKKLGAKLLQLEDALASLRKEREASGAQASNIRRTLLLPEIKVTSR
ncbi:MAG: hypothetical protein U0228_04760 [Myxococcaceae bacterium]